MPSHFDHSSPYQFGHELGALITGAMWQELKIYLTVVVLITLFSRKEKFV
jgi:hypothetical protein